MLKAKHRTGLVFFPAFDWAIDPSHPEREERLLYTQDQVLEEGILDIDGITEFKPDLITEKEISRVHFCVPDIKSVITESHLISAGGAKTIARSLMNKEIDRGFALVRPPGHHAMRMVHGGRGFCNINIEAIMVEYLRSEFGIKRIAIVDTDCHHGDGTQDIYWHDPDVLFISIHQDGRTLYPGSGFMNEFGGPNAAGKTLNIPLPPGTSAEGYLHVIENTVLPILDDFKPELIINSAGQDNHYTDPLTNMNFSAQGYADLTRILKADIAVLEGGYSIEGALPYVNVGIILAMAGIDYSGVTEPDYNEKALSQSGKVTETIHEISRKVLENWKMRDDFRKRFVGDNTYISRNRHIHYDTDGIAETQDETIRICDNCGGVIKTDSSSVKGKISAIHIPVSSCNTCAEEGYQWYEEADKKSFNKICLQDRKTDSYQER